MGKKIYGKRFIRERFCFSDQVAGNIRRGYTIGYVSTNPARDGTFRTVKVMALVPGRTGLTVRTRDGYTAPTPP